MAKKINKAPATTKEKGTTSSGGGLMNFLFGPASKENVVEWIKIIIFAVAVAALIRWPLIEPFKIPSGSMEPTLHGDARIGRGDRVFVNKWIYGVRYPFTNKRIWHGEDPQRWDIVVFKNPEPGAQHGTLVKRVVGLPGEQIQIRQGKIYANGKALETPPAVKESFRIAKEHGAKGIGDDIYYTSVGSYGVWPDPAHSVVPEGHYLVCGDNSGNSKDGRFFGWLPNENILGRVACIWFPPVRWRDFTGFTTTWWWGALVTLVALFTFWRLFIGRSVNVHTGVDETVNEGDHVLVNRVAFGVPVPFTRKRMTQGREAKRGEIVVYRPPSGNEHEFLLGHIAGLPREQVNVEDGRLTVDGALVNTPENLHFTAADGAAPYGRSKSKEYSLVPEGHYFIVAESGTDGLDSRSLGWIPRGNLVGTVSAVWWPRMRWLRLLPGWEMLIP